MPLLFLLLPFATLVLYLLTGSFLMRSSTTLLCLVIVLAFSVMRQRQRAALWVAVAFAFSFAGDYVLGHWGGCFEGFVVGVGLFLLAHLGYVAYSLCRGRVVWWLLALLVIVFGTYYILLLRPAISDGVTSIAVFAYILVSCLSMASAAGIQPSLTSRPHGVTPTSRTSTISSTSCSSTISSTSHFNALSHTPRFLFTVLNSRFLFIAGVASLLFSDLLIAQKRFVGDGTLYALMMPTYFASQLLITASLLERLGPLSSSTGRVGDDSFPV